jgi:hypothetical protein
VSVMKPFECEKEAQVIESVRTGSWDSELWQHAATCPACSEAALAARVLNEMRAVDLAEARVPDAGLMWWKAQLLAKREAAERVTQPINFVERFAYAWAAVCVIGVCVWQWQALRAWLASLGGSSIEMGAGSIRNFVSRFPPNWAPGWLAKSTYFQGFGLITVLSAGVLLALVAFATYYTRSEE